jgi:hypothetical protein
MQQQYMLYKPIIDMHVNKYRGSDVPEEVIRAKAKMILAETLNNYDPAKGDVTSLLHSNLQGLSRFVGESMQIRMPEHKRQKMKKVMDAIYDQYGEESDEQVDFKHMSKLLKMRPKTIQSIYAQSQRSIVSDPSIEAYAPTNVIPQTLNLDDIYNKLPSQKHKDVFDYSMGTHGKAPINTNRGIANTLGMSESYVRKLKEQILNTQFGKGGK